MKVEIYANYGMLAHEKSAVYTVEPATEAYDRITVEIPDDRAVMYVDRFGDDVVSVRIATECGDLDFRLREALCNYRDINTRAKYDAPALIDGTKLMIVDEL